VTCQQQDDQRDHGDDCYDGSGRQTRQSLMVDMLAGGAATWASTFVDRSGARSAHKVFT
jgi:hypothetical protein